MALEPHGGVLVDRFEGVDKDAAIASCSMELQLNPRQLCDVELICNGGFSPLTGFMNEADYTSVINDCKLANGLLFSLPVVFDTDDESIVPGTKILLKQDEVGGCVVVVVAVVLSSSLLAGEGVLQLRA